MVWDLGGWDLRMRAWRLICVHLHTYKESDIYTRMHLFLTICLAGKGKGNIIMIIPARTEFVYHTLLIRHRRIRGGEND